MIILVMGWVALGFMGAFICRQAAIKANIPEPRDLWECAILIGPLVLLFLFDVRAIKRRRQQAAITAPPSDWKPEGFILPDDGGEAG